MCFYVPNNQKVKTATKDIVCYKETYRNLLSYHHYFQYEVGKTYSIDNFPKYYENTIDEGFHSYISKISLYNIGNLFRLKCIIPKGSKYHVNKERNEYVSNSIKIIKIVK